MQALCLAVKHHQHVHIMATLTDAGVVDTGETLVLAAGMGREAEIIFLLQREMRIPRSAYS